MNNDWSAPAAARLAASHMSSMDDRWTHVIAVGAIAEMLAAETTKVPDLVVASAWLHDIGYAPDVVTSGFHPLDGAAFLADQRAPDELVSLVAYHSGAKYEAEERGLVNDLVKFAEPGRRNLDLLTLFDLTTGPTGRRVFAAERLTEILQRYGPGHVVHRAVKRAQDPLIESCCRAAQELGLSDEWVFTSV